MNFPVLFNFINCLIQKLSDIEFFLFYNKKSFYPTI